MTGRKVPVLIAGLATAVLSMIAIVFLFVAFLDYRRVDFATSSSTDDMYTLGTCIEAPSNDLIDQQPWSKDDWNCLGESDDKEKLAVMLSASVHVLYHALMTSVSPSEELRITTHAVLSATMGTADSVNSTLAITALREISELPGNCSEIYSGETAGEVPTPKPLSVACGPTELGPTFEFNTSTKQKLLAHCVAQFSYGTSGPTSGSGLIPVFGGEVGPLFWPLPKPSNFSSTAPNTKARVYLGLRFQWSLFGYFFLMLTLSFCVVDGIVVVVAEGTIEQRGDGVNAHLRQRGEEGGEAPKRTLRIMAATYISKRLRRTAILTFLIVISSVMLLLYVWLPWNFGSRLARPECKADHDKDGPLTRGGWRSDWDATMIEIICLGWTIVALVLTPLVRALSPVVKRAVAPLIKDAGDLEGGGQNKLVYVNKQSVNTGFRQLWAIFGTAILFAAYTIITSTFTSAWTDAVMHKDVSWTPGKVSDYIYTHALNGMFAMIACGMTISVIQGRWLIDGIGCSALLVVCLWILLAIMPFGLLVATIGIETFSDRSESVKECEIFTEGFNTNVCMVKWILLLVGTGILAVVIAYMSVLAFFKTCVTGLRSSRMARVQTTTGANIGMEKQSLIPNQSLRRWHLPLRFHNLPPQH